MAGQCAMIVGAEFVGRVFLAQENRLASLFTGLSIRKEVVAAGEMVALDSDRTFARPGTRTYIAVSKTFIRVRARVKVFFFGSSG